MLSASTRSSPSPPPTPKPRPRVFSSGRQSRPRTIAKNSYLASASSAAASDGDGDSETEAEALGVRVFRDDDVRRSRNDSPGNLQMDPHSTSAQPPEVRPPTSAPSTQRRSQVSASARGSPRPQAALFTERLYFSMAFSVGLPLGLVFDVRRGGEASLLIGALYIVASRLSREGCSAPVIAGSAYKRSSRKLLTSIPRAGRRLRSGVGPPNPRSSTRAASCSADIHPKDLGRSSGSVPA